MDNEKKYRKHIKMRMKNWDKYIFFIIVSIWFFVISFALISSFNPVWLQQLSDPGRAVEAQTQIDFANESLYSGNYQLAINYYLTALQIDPDNLNANGNLAIAYMYNGNYNEAEKCFKHYPTLKDSEFRMFGYYLNYGDYYERLGNIQEAFNMYQKAVEIHPGPIYALRKAGYYALKIEKDSLAFSYLTTSLKLAESITSIYLQALFGAHLDALTFSDSVNLKIINDEMLHIDAEQVNKRFDTNIYESLTKHSANVGYAKYYLGLYYQKQNNDSVANEYFIQAARAYPNLNVQIEEARKNLK
jgi:tetratricopeptide (TPR) repeat protein